MHDDTLKLPRQGQGPDWRVVLGIVLAFTVLGLGWTSAFSVSPEERALVLRFGKLVRETGSGLHWKLPYPFETVEKVPFGRKLREEFGFRTQSAGVRTQYQPVTPSLKAVSLMLTGDLNVVDVTWTTTYRIIDAATYRFAPRNFTATFRDLNESVMREVIGDRSVNEVLTTGGVEIQQLVQERLKLLCDQYRLGVAVEEVLLQDVNPPREVKPSFDEVNTAQQEADQRRNEAQAERNRLVPRRRGEAQRKIAEAEGYEIERVNRATGDAELFRRILAEYQQAPDVTRTRLYLETMREIYPKMQRKIIVDEDLQGIVPLLDLSGQNGIRRGRGQQ